MRVLYTGQEIRKEVQRIFAKTSERRVALVAFIGKGALAHLPKPKGLEVYCWPRAGCTIVSAIESLQERGAAVHFAERMHAKVYWSSKAGAVIASANLSDNAFGSGNLREAGVALASKYVDIDHLIESIDATGVTPESLETLRREEAIEKSVRTGGGASVNVPSFDRWYDGKGGTPWKWDHYGQTGGIVSKRAKEAVKQINPTFVPQDFCYCNKGEFRAEDWILRVRFTNKGLLIAPDWVFVELVVLVSKNDRSYDAQYPYQAVQARALRHCPAPPFMIDARFRSAVKQASTEFGSKKTEAQVQSKPPTDAFLKRIRTHF